MTRFLDVVLAGVLCILVAPIVALSVVAIALADPGPVLFHQWREGRDGRPFRMCKLRTMRRDAEERLEHLLAADPAARAEYERFFRLSDDPRVLPGVGRLLRRSSIDELPQLWNVLRGHMSLVGPRPFAADLIAALDPEFREARAAVRPGLTGLWQVSGRSDLELPELRDLDLQYLASRRLHSDLALLARTPLACARRRGAY